MAAWVVKDFIKNKQIQPFCEQWRQLCESQGFETVEEVRAMLTKVDEHPSLFPDIDTTKTTKRASFFRRLYEQKYPENAIDHETIWIMRKPDSGAS